MQSKSCILTVGLPPFSLTVSILVELILLGFLQMD